MRRFALLALTLCITLLSNVRAQIRGYSPPPVSVAAAVSTVITHTSPPVISAPTVIVPPPPPPPPPSVAVPIAPLQLPLSQQLPTYPIAPCLTCGFKPPSSAPEVVETDEQKQARRRAGIQELQARANELLGQKRYGPALETLDALQSLLEEESDPAVQEGREAIRALRSQVALALGSQLFGEAKYQEALDVFGRADASAAREEGMARSSFGLERYDDAFAKLDALSAIDASLATRLRGFFYNELGALPFAVEQYERVAENADISRVLSVLEQSGLRRFAKDSYQGWAIYLASSGVKSSRTLAYWFLITRNGEVDVTRTATLSVKPAPRELTFGLLVRNLLRLRWPETDNAREYSLAVTGSKRTDIVAMWDREPSQSEIVEMTQRGFDAAARIQRAEELLHEKRYDEAFDAALAEAKIEDWFFPRQPHYGALVKALQAAVEMKDEQRTRKLVAELADWHPMWAPLVLANAYEQSEHRDEARKAYDDAIAAAPLRKEPYEKAAAFEWTDAKQKEGADRAEGFLRAQRAARRLQQVDAAEGLWLRAQIAYELQANSLVSQLLAALEGNDDAPEAAVEMKVLLQAIGQSRFASTGDPVYANGGLRLVAYRTREPAPEDLALVHHSVEILVLNGDDDLVETFAISSQGVPPGSPRQFMLDRINALGLQPVRMYGARAPRLETIVKGLASL